MAPHAGHVQPRYQTSERIQYRFPFQNPNMNNKITITEYAMRCGISCSAIRKAIDSGRLKNALCRNDQGRLRIDPEIADMEWAINTAHHHKPTPQRFAGRTNHPTESLGDSVPAFQVSRAKREAFMAELARINLQEKEGTLVNSEAVKREAFHTARIVRDSLLNIPDRIAAELAFEIDPVKIHKKLTNEIR